MAQRGGSGTEIPRIAGKWRVFLLFAALTVLLGYPLSVRPGRTLLAEHPDILLFIWTLAWDVHAFTAQPLSIFDANIYYPQHLTLAYSENLIGSALFAAPIIWLTDNPVLALNVTALLTSVLCGLGTFVLARRLGISAPGAIIAGLVFAYSPARFFRLSQMHLTAVQWIPFSLASLHAYLDRGRPRDLRLAAAFFTLQALASGHGTVYLTLAILGLLAYRLMLGEPVAFSKRMRDLGIPGVLLLVPVVALFLPYRRVQVEMGLVRSLDGQWWPTPESFIASPSRLHAWLLSFLPGTPVNETASAFLFPGFLPLLLAAVALLLRAAPHAQAPAGDHRMAWRVAAITAEVAAVVCSAVATFVTVAGPLRIRVGTALLLSARSAERAWVLAAVAVALRAGLARRVPLEITPRIRRWRHAIEEWPVRYRRNPLPFYALLSLLSLLFILGPPLGLWPLVYWLPGMNFIRVPSRFIILALLGIAVLAGFGYERLSARVAPGRHHLLAGALALLLIVECAGIPLESVPYQWRIPSVDRWLAQQPRPFVVAEIPVKPHEWFHTTYMLHSTAHWEKTVHGYSGIRPALHEELYDKMRGFPDEPSLRSLAQLGVTYVVVHADLYPEREHWPSIDERLARYTDWLRLEFEAGPGRVYSLRPPMRD